MVDKIIPPGIRLSSLPKTEWEKEYNQYSDQKTFYPRSISFEDIDKSVFEWFNTRDIIINSKAVPAVFLTPEKWAEVKKSWSNMTSDHNITFPYITVRRSQAPKLSESPARGRIPNKNFTIYKVPVYTNAGPSYRIFKVPQPVKVDMEYEVRALTHYVSDINLINETLLRHFASLQAYLSIDNHYMPMKIESVSDESNLDSIEDERVMHTLYSIKVNGYIIDEKEFEEKTAISNMVVRVSEDQT